MAYDHTGNLGGSWDERAISYPAGLKVLIDGLEYETTGAAILESESGIYAARRWVAIAPGETSGHIRSRPRLIDERGVPGLKQRAERERLLQQREG